MNSRKTSDAVMRRGTASHDIGTGLLAGCLLLAAGQAAGQSNDGFPGPGLIDGDRVYANAVEHAAAVANDQIFRALDADCNPSGFLDQTPSPTFDDFQSRGMQAGPLCNADTFFVYLNARELVHTANELQGEGPTVASLGLDQEGLGTALRWTAAEELAAQGSMATEFANGQLSSLSARINALRFGAVGFGTAGNYQWLQQSSPLLAQVGGASSADDVVSESYSPWGGFINYGFGYGSKDPTALEDAFDFDGSELTFGVDYRLRSIVVGGIVGLTDQDIDFDESASAISVVDGSMQSEGDSIMFFALHQGERLTLNGSIGVQSLEYDVERNIKYPSFNPDLSSIYSSALSAPEADIRTMTFGAGYAFSWGKLTFEPSLDVELLDVTIDSFAEQRSLNLLSNSAVSRRFDLVVGEQDIKSLKTSIGLRFQYVVTPRFGVIVPYGSIAAHKEHEDESRTISTGYAALEDVLGASTFELPTDVPDSSYFTATAGFSMLLRGGRQRSVGGPIAGGLSGFFQYGTVQDLDNYESRVITGGLRYEF